jgi:hypothetical protein
LSTDWLNELPENTQASSMKLHKAEKSYMK